MKKTDSQYESRKIADQGKTEKKYGNEIREVYGTRCKALFEFEANGGEKYMQIQVVEGSFGSGYDRGDEFDRSLRAWEEAKVVKQRTDREIVIGQKRKYGDYVWTAIERSDYKASVPLPSTMDIVPARRDGMYDSYFPVDLWFESPIVEDAEPKKPEVVIGERRIYGGSKAVWIAVTREEYGQEGKGFYPLPEGVKTVPARRETNGEYSYFTEEQWFGCPIAPDKNEKFPDGERRLGPISRRVYIKTGESTDGYVTVKPEDGNDKRARSSFSPSEWRRLDFAPEKEEEFPNGERRIGEITGTIYTKVGVSDRDADTFLIQPDRTSGTGNQERASRYQWSKWELVPTGEIDKAMEFPDGEIRIGPMSGLSYRKTGVDDYGKIKVERVDGKPTGQDFSPNEWRRMAFATEKPEEDDFDGYGVEKGQRRVDLDGRVYTATGEIRRKSYSGAEKRIAVMVTREDDSETFFWVDNWEAMPLLVDPVIVPKNEKSDFVPLSKREENPDFRGIAVGTNAGRVFLYRLTSSYARISLGESYVDKMVEFIKRGDVFEGRWEDAPGTKIAATFPTGVAYVALATNEQEKIIETGKPPVIEIKVPKGFVETSERRVPNVGEVRRNANGSIFRAEKVEPDGKGVVIASILEDGFFVEPDVPRAFIFETWEEALKPVEVETVPDPENTKFIIQINHYGEGKLVPAVDPSFKEEKPADKNSRGISESGSVVYIGDQKEVGAFNGDGNLGLCTVEDIEGGDVYFQSEGGVSDIMSVDQWVAI